MQIDPENIIKSMIPFQMMQIGKIQAEQERARVVKLTEEAQMRKQVEDTKRVLVG